MRDVLTSMQLFMKETTQNACKAAAQLKADQDKGLVTPQNKAQVLKILQDQGVVLATDEEISELAIAATGTANMARIRRMLWADKCAQHS